MLIHGPRLIGVMRIYRFCYSWYPLYHLLCSLCALLPLLLLVYSLLWCFLLHSSLKALGSSHPYMTRTNSSASSSASTTVRRLRIFIPDGTLCPCSGRQRMVRPQHSM
jgi:hypothetical protein